MKLSKYIKVLQKLEEKGFGDFEVIYASDDEGNSYDFVSSLPEPVMVYDLEDYDLEVAHPDDVEEYNPNCIVVN